MNMSYCRFRNTASDMADCIEALQYGEVGSEEEQRAGYSMFCDILDFLEDEGVVEETTTQRARLNAIFGR